MKYYSFTTVGNGKGQLQQLRMATFGRTLLIKVISNRVEEQFELPPAKFEVTLNRLWLTVPHVRKVQLYQPSLSWSLTAPPQCIGGPVGTCDKGCYQQSRCVSRYISHFVTGRAHLGLSGNQTKPGRVGGDPARCCTEAIYAPLEGAAVRPRLREVSCETVSTSPPSPLPSRGLRRA